MMGNLLVPLLIGVWCLTVLIVVLGLNEVYHLRVTAKKVPTTGKKAGDTEVPNKDTSLATKTSYNTFDAAFSVQKNTEPHPKIKYDYVFLQPVDTHFKELKTDLRKMMARTDYHRRSKKEQRPDVVRPRDIHSTEARTPNLAREMLIRADGHFEDRSPRRAVATETLRNVRPTRRVFDDAGVHRRPRGRKR
jgi:hypothetical protein